MKEKWNLLKNGIPKRRDNEKGVLCVVIRKDKRKPVLAKYLYDENVFYDLYSEDALYDVIKYIALPDDDLIGEDVSGNDISKNDNRHRYTYDERLKEFVITKTDETDEFWDRHPLEISLPGYTWRDIIEAKPVAFVQLINMYFKQINNLSEENKICKKWFQMNVKYILSSAYRSMKMLADECIFEYKNLYDDSPSTIVILSEFPEARIRLVQFLSAFERSHFYTAKELEAIRNARKKREEERKRERGEWISYMESLGFEIEASETMSNSHNLCKIIMDKKAPQFVARKKHVDGLCSDFMKKNGWKVRTKAVDRITKNMTELHKIMEGRKEWEYGSFTTRAEFIAYSDQLYEEFLKEYDRLNQ